MSGTDSTSMLTKHTVVPQRNVNPIEIDEGVCTRSQQTACMKEVHLGPTSF